MGHSVRPRPCHGAIRCVKTVVRQVRRAQRPPVQPYCSDDTGCHVGAGFGRKPSISRRISAKSLRGIATSASWNVTYRPCRTTFASILISFLRSIVSDECSTSAGKANDRYGSKADENRPSAPGPLSDLKLTQFGGNRTLGHEGLLSGRQRKSEGTPLNSRS